MTDGDTLHRFGQQEKLCFVIQAFRCLSRALPIGCWSLPPKGSSLSAALGEASPAFVFHQQKLSRVASPRLRSNKQPWSHGRGLGLGERPRRWQRGWWGWL